MVGCLQLVGLLFGELFLLGCGWLLLFVVDLLGVWCTCGWWLILGFRLRAMLGLFDCVYVWVICVWFVDDVCFGVLFGLCLVYLLFGLVACLLGLAVYGAVYWFGLLDLFDLVWF